MMKMMIRRGVVAVLSLLTLCMPCAAQNAQDAARQDAKDLKADVASKLAEYMKAAAEVYDFVGAVAVTRGKQTLYEAGFGLANYEHNVPNTAETKFRLGSVTKPFTAMAILLLAEQGKLNVADPISKHLPPEAGGPALPEAWQPITIHHLLTHTSGIHNYTDLPDMMNKTVRLPASPREVVDTVRNMPLDFPPGQQFSYSNTGYILLGQIIEHASGPTTPRMKYEAFMRQAILEPLNLKDTGYDRSSRVLTGRASGYMKDGERFENAPYLDMDWPFAAGALYSTVQDLARWCQALDEGKLLSEESYKAMYTPGLNRAGAGPEQGGYAYGWNIGQMNGRRMISHGGGIHGFQSIVLRFPDEKLSVVGLSNVLPSPVGKISRELALIALGEDVPLPRVRKAVAIDPKSFDGLTGQYQLAPGMVVSFRRDGDRFFTQLTGQDEFEIFPESELNFFLKVVDAQLTFILDEQRLATAVVLHQNGRNTRAERISSGKP